MSDWSYEQSPKTCKQCHKSECQIKFLLEKINLLEDIINTSKIIEQVNMSLYNNLADVGTQTGSFVESSDLEYNGQYDMESIDQYDMESIALSPESINTNPPPSQSHYNVSVSPVSSFVDEDIDLHLEKAILDIKNVINELENSDKTNCMRPLAIIDNQPFAKFSVDTLTKELNFTHMFQNRNVVYYGSFPYKYQGGEHRAQNVPPGSYISSICSYLDVILPDYEYNSVLISYYKDGTKFIPAHSDCEECIEDESDILTVSLGATRTLKITNSMTGEEVRTDDLKHGELTAMTKLSQQHYKHEILPNPTCTQERVSLTFRLIKPVVPQRNTRVIEHDNNASGYVPFDTFFPGASSPVSSKNSMAELLDNLYSDDEMEKNHQSSGSEPPAHYTYTPPSPSPQPPQSGPHGNRQRLFKKRFEKETPPNDVSTVFISSSMFRHLDEKLLSSSSQRTKVFFYPGANSVQMSQRLFSDNHFKNLNKEKVKKVVLLTGTNYVDSLDLNTVSFNSATKDIELFVEKLWAEFISAKICILNILPRAVASKNCITQELNQFIENMCCRHGLLFINTENENNLFTLNNNRKEKYFGQGHDNVHLNKLGIARLGKHLKYVTHLC